MSRKEKGRNRNGATLKKFHADDYPRGGDPLTGWINLGKQSRVNRRQKRNWQRGRR